MNPLYSMLMGRQQIPQQPSPQLFQRGGSYQNPMQRLNEIMLAMRNPAAFVKQKIPSIPDQILNDPNQILQYMQQNLGVTEQDIQNAAGQIPRF